LTKQTASPHPFGELLAQYRARRPGLSQRHLAELAGYDQAILVRMAQGKKDLTGPSGRERVIRIIETLADQHCLSTVEEANGLLAAAGQPPLYDGQPMEARLLTRLMRASAGHRVRRTNLPALLAGFVGRAQEIAEVRSLLNQSRLVTLTGSGGAGKTRLAQRVAADVLLHFTDGVWYAELATLVDSSSADPASGSAKQGEDRGLIAETVARIFGLSTSSQSSFDDLANFLRERHALVVLDNCEHLIDSVTDFAQRLLSECARLSILATSREALNVEGEVTWRVPPMQPNEAARLFVERARLAKPQQPLHEDDPTVSHICARLDGMPLALELAAARLSTLSLNDIAARLDDRFALLTEGRRGALPRHQTLQALIDWSHELLGAQEKSVFRRLSVFVGGWTLHTAMQVACDETVREREVMPLLSQLIRKSLVVVDERAGETRYTFLETIREYALEKLREAGELNVTRQRHAKAFMQMAEASREPLHGAQQREWLMRLVRDYSNLQAAMAWCLLASGDALIGCRIAGALYHFWNINTGHHHDARKWAQAAHDALNDDMPADVRAWVLLIADAFIFDFQKSMVRRWHIHDLFIQAGDAIHAAFLKPIIGEAYFYAERNFETTRRLSEEGVEEARTLGADWELRYSLWMLGQCLRLSQKDPARAEQVYRESAELSKAASDLHEYARTLGNFISLSALERRNFDEAKKCAEEAFLILESLDDVAAANSMRLAIAQCLYYQGDVPAAMALIEESKAIARERLPAIAMYGILTLQARISLSQRDYTHASALLKASLELRVGDTKQGEFVRFSYPAIDGMAALAAGQGQATRAAHLRGIADQFMALNHHYRMAHVDWEYAPYMTKAHEALGDTVFDAAYAEGRAMPHEQAIAYALGEGEAKKPITS
jgi:predicted ATPase